LPHYIEPADALHQSFLRFDKAYRFLAGDTKAVERQYKPYALALLQAAGFDLLQIGVCGATAPVDLVVNGYQVELKVSRCNSKAASWNGHRREHYYKALLRDHANHHFLNGHFVLLLCVLPTSELCPFVIPTWAVGDRRTIEITSDPFTYNGRWAHYRGAFHLLKESSHDDADCGL